MCCPGLADAPYHTNATLFNVTALPPRVVVVGAGPIGLEMAQALAVFGSKVTCVLRSAKVLPKEDPDAAALVRAALERDGVEFLTSVSYKRVEHAPPKKGAAFPTIGVVVEVEGSETRLDCEMLLVATGRKPNVEHCGLDKAGVVFDVRDGVQVDDYLRTTNPDVYAVGDVCTRYQSVWKSNLQHDFNVSVFESFDASTSVVLREIDESNRFVQKSAESTSI